MGIPPGGRERPVVRTMAERATVRSASAPSVPRLHLQSTLSHHTLLDGGWWPRTTDPVAELPGLVLALDRLRGPVIHVMLGALEWDSHPRRLGIGDRVIRLGWFASQPTGLLTATCSDGKRVDLLVVPPTAAAEAAATAMATAATSGNAIHTPQILTDMTRQPSDAAMAAENSWETDGGHLRTTDPR